MLITKVCVVYTHRKIGDLIWQLPYIKAISENHQNKIELVVRKQTQAKDIFKDLEYISEVHYNEFRKGIYYWIDVFKLYTYFKKKNYDFIYILDKVSKPAIASKLAGIKKIIGPGIGRQKLWVTNKNKLKNEDKKLNYSEQSLKLLKINEIKIKNKIPELIFNNKIFHTTGKKIAFGVDSSENYKMWFEEMFVDLADKLNKHKIFDYIYLICGPDKKYISKKIINLSKKNYFIDCSDRNLVGVINAIKDSIFFIGNNAGPLNLASALGVKTFGLIANDPVSELIYSRIIPITPDDYQDNVWNRNREGMKKLTVEKVYSEIISKI